MRILIIGGTGLLGSEAAAELLRRGHEVVSLALPPAPKGAALPPEMALMYGNYMEMADGELLGHLSGCDGLVFAAGVDERVEGPPPIYAMFQKYNITPLKRLLRLAKQAGVSRAVICGSYFSYFDKLWPQLELTKWHPYIRSRREQEHMALSFADDSFAVSMLELPYIFGAQPGRKPVWTILVDMLRRMKLATFYPRGGTAMVTVRQAGQAIAGAVEQGEGGMCYPIGYDNLSWRTLLTIVHQHMGCPERRIITIPDWMFKLAAWNIMRKQKAARARGWPAPGQVLRAAVQKPLYRPFPGLRFARRHPRRYRRSHRPVRPTFNGGAGRRNRSPRHEGRIKSIPVLAVSSSSALDIDFIRC